MFRMAVGHSDDIDLDAALQAVFAECDAGLDGSAPSAGLLHVAWDADHAGLVETIRARYPGIRLAGASTAAEMSSVIGFAEDSVSLALFASDDVQIGTGLGRHVDLDPAAAATEAVDAARAGATDPPRLCIVMAAIGGYEPARLLDGLRAALGPDVPILGGGAAPEDPTAPPPPWINGLPARRGSLSHQIADGEVVDDGVAVMVFSGPLAVSFGVETGWRAVGPRGHVTRSSPEGVLEIDGRPATEFYARYLGLGQPPIANPLAVYDAGDPGSFYLRTPVGYDPASGLVAFFGTVPEDAEVQLTVAAAEEIFGGARSSIEHALAAYPEGRRPDGALLYSCATRRLLLGTRADREIALIRDALGPSIPVAGFYCQGEIAPSTSVDAMRFHNATMVSVLLGSA